MVGSVVVGGGSVVASDSCWGAWAGVVVAGVVVVAGSAVVVTGTAFSACFFASAGLAL